MVLMVQDMGRTAWRRDDHMVTRFKVHTFLGLANSTVACAHISCIVLCDCDFIFYQTGPGSRLNKHLENSISTVKERQAKEGCSVGNRKFIF